MNIFKCLVLIITTMLMTSCHSQNTEVLWIRAFKSECDSGNGKRECLQVYYGEDLNNANWELMYTPIQGFEFEKGYYKKIKVQKQDIENPPADASSIKYILVKELEKTLDKRIQIDGQWILNSINGKQLTDSMSKPNLVIDVGKMRTSGSDGCNQFSGAIKSLSDDQLVVGNLMSTRKACLDMEVPYEFNRTLSKVKTYTVNKTQLILIDGEDNSVLTFNKE